MQTDEQLLSSPVYRNLDYRWSKFGIGLDDIPFLAAPATVGLFMVALSQISILWIVLVEICTALFIVMVKWRRPPDYLPNLLILWLMPRRLSHKERDDRGAVFPLNADLTRDLTSRSIETKP